MTINERDCPIVGRQQNKQRNLLRFRKLTVVHLQGKELREEMRHLLYTKFGTRSEGSAITQYEKQTGSEEHPLPLALDSQSSIRILVVNVFRSRTSHSRYKSFNCPLCQPLLVIHIVGTLHRHRRALGTEALWT